MKRRFAVIIVCFGLSFVLSNCKKEKVDVTACFATPGSLYVVNKPVDFIDCGFIAYTSGAVSHWDFGDGQTANGVELKHTFTQPGIYIVTLTLSYNGSSNTKTQTDTIVAINNADFAGTYRIYTFFSDSLYSPSDTVPYIATITTTSPNAIVFHNFRNGGNDLTGTTSGDTASFAQQPVGSQTAAGTGNLSADKKQFNMLYAIGPSGGPGKGYIISCQKQ